MKKLIHQIFNKRGYVIAGIEEHGRLKNHSTKLNEFAREFYFLVGRANLSNLPPVPSSDLISCLQDLIGTSPFEGLSILDALYETKEIDGDICEFGIAQGATSRLLATWLMEENSKKNLWLFDSFQGLSEPTSEDRLKDDIFNLGGMKEYGGTMAFGQEVAKKKLAQINFPQDRLRMVPGFIEETIKNEDLPETVTFAYVDFDLYKPIKVALSYLKRTLSPGGIIIVDDYDFFSTGAKKAVDEFIEENKDDFHGTFPEKELGHFYVMRRNIK